MKILKLGLLLSIILLINSCQEVPFSFEGYNWTTLECNGEPAARHEASFVEADGMFYLLGGRRIQEVSIFNPETNTWTSGKKPPIELHHFQGCYSDGKIYVVGAQTDEYPHEAPTENAYTYTPETDTWEKAFAMPANRLRGSTTASIYENKLYIAGGIIDGHWDGHVKWFDCYDFKTEQWESMPDIPHFRDHASSVVIDNKLYLVGGRKTSRVTNEVLELTEKNVDVFDFKTNEWITLDQPIITQRAGGTAISVNGLIVFTGGESATQMEAHSQVECYDPTTGIWTSLPSMNTGRHGTQLIWHNDNMYIASGCSERGGSTEQTTLEYFSKLPL